MRRQIIGMAIVAGIMVGCGDSTRPTSIYGTFPLLTVHGKQPPVAIRDEPTYTFKITGGTITLNSDSTFIDSYDIWESRAGVDTTWTLPCPGTWTRTAARSFTLREAETLNCGDVASAEWDGRNRLAITWGVFGAMVHWRVGMM